MASSSAHDHRDATPTPDPGDHGSEVALSWAQWEQLISSPGQQLAGLGWEVHVTTQMEMPSGEVAWTAALARHARHVATVEQAGDGGAPTIRWGQGPGVHPEATHAADLYRVMWERDLTAVGTEADTALTALDQIDVTSAPRSGDRAEPAAAAEGRDRETAHDAGQASWTVVDHGQYIVHIEFNDTQGHPGEALYGPFDQRQDADDFAANWAADDTEIADVTVEFCNAVTREADHDPTPEPTGRSATPVALAAAPTPAAPATAGPATAQGRPR